MLNLKTGDLYKLQTDAIVIPVAEDEQLHENERVIFLTGKTETAREFKGARGDELTLYNLPSLKSPRVIFLGLGKKNKIDAESLRAVCGKAVRKCIKNRLRRIMIAAPSSGILGMEIKDIIEPMLEGAYLGNHIFNKYKEEKKNKPLEKINFFVEPQIIINFSGLPSQVETVCKGTLLAREWVSTPSNCKKPEQFAKNIASIAKKENLIIKNFDYKYLKRFGFGSILAVAAGSRNKPRLLILKYDPKGAKKKQ